VADGEDPTESIMNLPEVPGFPAVPSNPPGQSSTASEDIDFDDLTRRFQDLKKRK
jgi:vacuolar protein sorting-associated protein IST1